MRTWHTLSANEVFKETGSQKDGLSSEEASARLARDGKNALEEAKKKS
mgnify:FL=1